MGDTTNISWADKTFNKWIGCTKKMLDDGTLSEECRNCYAEDMMDKRYGRVKWGKGQPRTLTSEHNQNDPHRWQRKAVEEGNRPRVFCSSLSDVFDPEVPIEWQAELLQTIEDTPNLDWLILTKRPEEIMGDPFDGHRGILERVIELDGPGKKLADFWFNNAPPKNVWLGTTAGTQKSAEERIPKLLSVPAYVRFLSIEPLLEYVTIDHLVVEDLSSYGYFLGGDPRKFTPDLENSEEEIQRWKDACAAWEAGEPEKSPQGPSSIGGHFTEGTGDAKAEGGFIACGTSGLGLGITSIHECGIDWVIVGGESGDKARPMHPLWVMALKDQCAELGIPFFFKQWGDWAPRDGNVMACGKPLAAIDPHLKKRNMALDDGAGEIAVMQKIGKKKAGDLLYGELYLNFPKPTHHKSAEV